jgi:hypothetical protein
VGGKTGGGKEVRGKRRFSVNGNSGPSILEMPWRQKKPLQRGLELKSLNWH